MIVKLGDIEIIQYDAKDEKQRHLKYVLDHDADFRKYVTKKLEERLRETTMGGGLQFNSSYLVKYKSEFVGYIRLENLRWDGTVNIEWAVSPEYRNQKYGKIIVETVSNYILEHFEEVKKIRGVIDKSNYASRKVALNSGFLEEEVDSEYNYDYVYVTKSR